MDKLILLRKKICLNLKIRRKERIIRIKIDEKLKIRRIILGRREEKKFDILIFR